LIIQEASGKSQFAILRCTTMQPGAGAVCGGGCGLAVRGSWQFFYNRNQKADTIARTASSKNQKQKIEKRKRKRKRKLQTQTQTAN
jgi:hypothetical protein